tara:strand:+ start:78 stop:1334 length:1257 start_codon:yes stop_codon:yes gene_type:complete
MKICIPSYERYETINDKSLGLLFNYGFFPEEIDLFVANKEQYDKYKSVVHKDINIIIAVKGLKEVREFIFNYYDQGEKLLCIDDDIEAIRELYYDSSNNSQLKSVDNLKEIVDKGFEECEKNSLKLWGLYPVKGNPYWMSNSKEITTDYKFIIGNFFGCINCKDMNLINVSNIDDYERSIRSYKIYGGSVRLNHYSALTNFKKNKGGAQYDPDRETKIKIDYNILISKYPEYITFKNKKDGLNPILKEIKNINKEIDLTPLFNFKYPVNKGRKNIMRKEDPVYRGFVLGKIKSWAHKDVKKTGHIKTDSRKTMYQKYKEVYEIAKQIAKKNNIKYTTIQFNKNYQCAKHIDKNNVGESSIIGLGDYEGGELLIYYDGENNPPQKINIKNKFYKFNGSKYYHETAPFKGERHTLVYYNI